MARKGITDIIAIVLLLMITISMVGFAWIWFQRTSQTAMTKTENQMDTQMKTSQQTVQIDNVYAAGGMITIRNTGTQSINASQVGVYADGVKVTCTGAGWTTSIPVSGTVTCTANTSISSCTSIKVTAPGNIDTMSC